MKTFRKNSGNAIVLFTNKSRFVATLMFAIVIMTSTGVMSPVEIKATDYTPALVLWQDYAPNRERLNEAYQQLYGVPWDANDTTFFYNPDSVMLDANSPLSLQYKRLWIRGYMDIRFGWNIIPRDEVYEDNRWVYYTIDDILPKYEKTIADFKKLEEKWGKFKFVDMNTTYPDTLIYIEGVQAKSSRCLSIVFDNYYPIHCWASGYGYDTAYHKEVVGKEGDILSDDILNIELVNSTWLHYSLSGDFFTWSVPEKSDFLHLDIYPNITSDQVTLNLPEELIILPKTIKILDTVGNLIRTYYTGVDTQQTLNILGLASGRYFVQVDNYVGSFIVR